MNCGKIILLTVFFFAGLAGRAAADDSAGTAGMQFLKIIVGARQAALGEYYCPAIHDPTSIFSNPAALSGERSIRAALSHTSWFGDVSEQAASFAYPAAGGTFGAGILYLHMGALQGYDVDSLGNPVRTGDFGASDTEGIFSYARQFGRFSAGVSAKLFQEKLANEQATGIAFDIGASAELGDAWEAGVVARNFGMPVRFVSDQTRLPFVTEAGVSYRLLDKTLLLTGAANLTSDNGIKGSLGTEYTFERILSLRVGYNGAYALHDGISMGLGFALREWNIDYSYIPNGSMNDIHRVTIMTRL